MNAARVSAPALALGLALAVAPPALAGGLDVEIWTDRGNDAVYQPGDGIEVRVRTSDDAYLVLYEIDAQGAVRVIHPERGGRGWVRGRQTQRVPSRDSDLELVVEGPAGQGFLVAIASREPFRELPWYLRPYDAHAEGVGYEGDPEDEQGVTREGRIVGDPYVAMERIRREVLADPDDDRSFATAFASYYVHHEVRYPRYLCNDCHRPGHWTWSDGFDPYDARCSVFDFRVNWNWGWGPGYWHGFVPYYYYVYRTDCPPRYRVFASRGGRHSSWEGWPRWSSLWGGDLRRYKPDPPPDHRPPDGRERRERRADRLPPGFLADRGGDRGRRGAPILRERPPREPGRGVLGGRGDRERAPDPDLGSRAPRPAPPKGRASWIEPSRPRSEGQAPKARENWRDLGRSAPSSSPSRDSRAPQGDRGRKHRQ